GSWIVALPLVLLSQLLLVIGCGVIYSSLVPFVPDLRYVMDALLRAVMFMSGIFFDIEKIQSPYKDWLLLNPMAGLIADMRLILLQNAPPDWWRLGESAFVGLLLLTVGALVLKRFGPRYTKLPN